ncbi:antitoxin (DNA-binding transcriptional repressor) of toxin-antitoxin stability system [Rhodoblastus acidophilus]|uniref:type II toxin-antitoxin system Phd/YefM family antitoxin n=1 Tax=Rhodoblastus acidophilus TaxID=1074 RepID=UPI00222427CB|nr:type II toxin-antitoxin system prevent-host-death family antitoxin [Rhodoblastus acidophilus]MCW2286295.1 antitoxin (DNA-binding transcriptional repressor) of toxin-antitoxin stability system [Rhodoblastus acidophilus]MCW2335190.1 antitoxin (DNA-binding transcriptional repressor) of toxin-antitoxin stability system [Rhodoblastus acidophilus]
MTMLLTVDEVMDQWDALLARVEAGEEVLIARNGAPVARLIRFGPEPASENVDSETEPLPKP